jgi:hypothetical protein
MAVPLMDFKSHRAGLTNWAAGKGEEAMKAYREKKNRQSIDGLPAPMSSE